MKKNILTVLLGALAISASAEAAMLTPGTITYEKGSTYVSGEVTLTDVEEPRDIMLTVKDDNNKINYVDILTTDENGKATFRYNNLGKSGKYTFIFDYAPESKKEQVEIDGFKGNDYWSKVVSDIDAAAKTGDKVTLNSLMTASFEDFGIDTTDYDLLADKTAVYDIMIKSYKKYENSQDIVHSFEGAVLLAGYNELKTVQGLEDLYEADITEDYFGIATALPESKNSGKTIMDDFSAELKNDILNVILSKKFECFDDVKQIFLNDILTAAISKGGHYGIVMQVTDAYAEKGILNLTSVNEAKKISVCKAMNGKSYADAKNVETAYNALASGSTGGSSSSGGSSSGSTSGSSNKVNVQVPAVPVAPQTGNNEGNTNNSGAQSGKMYFTDIEDAKWALGSINNMYEKGIINGVGDGKFEPHREVTRAEAAKLFVNVLGLETSTAETPFSDVDSKEWYFEFVATAYKKGVFAGRDNGTFGINDSMTRQEAAVAVCRMISGDANFAGDFTYNDDNEIASWAKGAVYYLRNAGIMKGRSGDSFEPNAKLTRVEAAVICNSVYNHVNK